MIQRSKQQPPPSTSYPFLVCPDLESLERPRYFTGQLLTADELNSEQTYITAKHRLHHRYLHGPRGRVVAGLQVVMSEKPGFVDITPGYAIDYCGNDIVVPTIATFNVIAQIRANVDGPTCLRGSVWNPANIAQGKESKPINQQYWLTLAYDEQEVRPANALRQNIATSTSRRKDCGCGNRQSSSSSTIRNSTSSAAQSNQSLSPSVCEPTRIREWYRCDIIAASEPATDLSNARLTEDNRLVLARVTIQNGSIILLENEVASRQIEPSSSVPQTTSTSLALSALQDTVLSLQDVIGALQDEIAQLKAVAVSHVTESSSAMPSVAAPSMPESPSVVPSVAVTPIAEPPPISLSVAEPPLVVPSVAAPSMAEPPSVMPSVAVTPIAVPPPISPSAAAPPTEQDSGEIANEIVQPPPEEMNSDTELDTRPLEETNSDTELDEPPPVE